MEEPNTSVMVGIPAADRRVSPLKVRPTRHEDVGLAGEVGSPRFGQVDEGQVVGGGHLLGPQALGHGGRARGAAPNGGVVCADDAHGALDQPDPGDQAAAQRIVGAPPGQGAELQERRVAIHQQVDALAHQQPSPLAVSGHVAVAAALDDLVLSRRAPRPGVRAWRHGWPGALRHAHRCWSTPPDSWRAPTARRWRSPAGQEPDRARATTPNGVRRDRS